MRNPSTTTGEQLANALYALGVRFVMDGTNAEESLHKEPTRLIAALAESNEARLRLSLIPLFLEYPEFAAHVRAAARGLSAPARLTLRCYYSAAVWLQRKYRLRLDALLGQKPFLPDHFSGELELPVTDDAEENLRLLAERHQALSGMPINWLGTYEHAVRRLLNHAEGENQWLT